jgi:hypothetical protein
MARFATLREASMSATRLGIRMPRPPELMAYLDRGRRPTATAAALSVHVNTV